MLAYYASILQYRNLFSKMLAYYAGIICQHLSKEICWVATCDLWSYGNYNLMVHLICQQPLIHNYLNKSARTKWNSVEGDAMRAKSLALRRDHTWIQGLPYRGDPPSCTVHWYIVLFAQPFYSPCSPKTFCNHLWKVTCDSPLKSCDVNYMPEFWL